VLYESVKHVTDYNADPVSRAYEEFYGSEKGRTCAGCGHVTPRPSEKQESAADKRR
jgi:3-hydroxyanthranilate 3,4-dioxygenase